MIAFARAQARPRRRMRLTGWVTLLVWLLALLAGMVNACQIQPRDHAALHVERDHHDRHDGLRHTEDDAGKAGCSRFCDDESSTLAKSKASPTDLPQAMVLATVEWPAPTPASLGAVRRSAERPASPGPPLFMRLLRLTI